MKKGSKKIAKRRLGKHPVLLITSICVICFAILAGGFAYFQMKEFETGILEVCATQQDAYVQLVLDQINLKENRNDEQIIKDIIGTMDASSNKYWTFSKNQSMLFVKDVLETNKYKGFTTATYYDSESAKDFLDSLQTNRVIHDYIDVNGNEFVASGVAFEYNKGQYKLCLLTDSSVLLDNNAYLEAKIELGTFAGVVLILLMIVPMLFAYKMRKMQFFADSQEESISAVNLILSNMNQRIMERDLHDTRQNMWQETALPTFLEKLQARNLAVTVLILDCDTIEQRRHLVAKAHYLLDNHVLRFSWEEKNLLLIFIQVEEMQARNAVTTLCTEGVKLGEVYSVSESSDYDTLYEKLSLERDASVQETQENAE